MKFTSFEFIIFFIVIFFLYWFVFKNNLKLQNVLLLIASYFFYGYWDYRFLSLIFISSFLDFFIGKKLNIEESIFKRKLLLSISLIANLGMLGVFKYYNFFATSFAEMYKNIFGTELSFVTLNIILPVGISFYTFQTLSYTIDVYRRKLRASNDPIAFFAYVSFFPQLVAGPIERAINLLPQFERKRHFDYHRAKDGLRQILWGFFKKIVIADNVGTYVDQFYSNPSNFTGSELVLGAFYFSFQIYCDFSGYSDIAIGTARVFGFDLMKNFNFPYFSRDIGEFWRRWHISLSTWFRDYLYIPLGGSKVNTKGRLFFNVMAIFVVSGLWHGANWTFIAWGFLNALLFLPSIMTGRNRKNLDTIGEGYKFPPIKDIFGMIFTFAMVNLLWVFFRANTVSDALIYISGIFDKSFFTIPSKLGGIPMIILLLIMEWRARTVNHALENLQGNTLIRWAGYISLIMLIIVFTGEEKVFIYFQF
jgi:D-alanyl-lipoteichoic acid acyltransferase DltB (MBOAT superfamily)